MTLTAEAEGLLKDMGEQNKRGVERILLQGSTGQHQQQQLLHQDVDHLSPEDEDVVWDVCTSDQYSNSNSESDGDSDGDRGEREGNREGDRDVEGDRDKQADRKGDREGNRERHREGKREGERDVDREGDREGDGDVGGDSDAATTSTTERANVETTCSCSLCPCTRSCVIL